MPETDVLFSSVERNYMLIDLGPHMSREKYHLLVTTELKPDEDKLINHWSHGIQLQSQIGFKRMAITINSNLEVLKIFLVCQLCRKYKYTLIQLCNANSKPPLRLSFTSVKATWRKVNSINIGVPWLIHDERQSKESSLVRKLSTPLLEVTKRFKTKLHDINHILFTTVVHNGTPWGNAYELEEIEYHWKYAYAPKIQFNDESPGRVVTLEEKSFKFLTCDGAIRNSVSFVAYISAFDFTTWAILLVCSFMTVLMQYLIVHCSVKKVTRLAMVEMMENQFRILLEQDENIMEKVTSTKSITILNFSWILMGIVLSNAYKGNNIRELCAPVGLELIDTYDKLVSHNFTLYSYPMVLVENLYRNVSYNTLSMAPDQKDYFNASYSVIDLKYNEEHSVLGQELSDLKSTLYAILHKLKRESSDTTQNQKEQSKLAKLLENYSQIQEITRIPYEYGNGVTPFMKVLDCKRNAYGDWSSTIDAMKIKMEKLKPTRLIIKSVEGIIARHTGWRMQMYNDEKIIDRLGSVHESGITQMWVELQTFSRMLEISMLQGNEQTTEEKLSEQKPIMLALEHNVSTVFVVLFSLVAWSMLTFMVEVFYAKNMNMERTVHLVVIDIIAKLLSTLFRMLRKQTYFWSHLVRII